VRRSTKTVFLSGGIVLVGVLIWAFRQTPEKLRFPFLTTAQTVWTDNWIESGNHMTGGEYLLPGPYGRVKALLESYLKEPAWTEAPYPPIGITPPPPSSKPHRKLITVSFVNSDGFVTIMEEPTGNVSINIRQHRPMTLIEQIQNWMKGPPTGHR